MARRKVLFISYFFPPIRSVESVMALQQLKYLPDCDVTVIAADAPRHFSVEPVAIPEHIRVIRVKAPNNRFMHALYSLKFTTDPEMAWLPFARRAVRDTLSRETFDVMVSRANPVSSHLAVPKDMKIPWIAMYGDPGALHPYIRCRFPGLRKIHMWIDRKIISSADAVVVTSEQTKRLFADAYGHSEKMHVLPNTYDPEEFKDIPERKQGGGKFKILHAGSFYNLRSPKHFLQAYRLFLGRHPKSAGNVEVVFAGSLGKYEGLLKPFHGNIVLKRNLSRDALKQEYAGSDALLLIDAPVPKSPFFPAKLPEYFAAKRPILALSPEDGASADAVREANAGVVVPPSDVPKIADALEGYYSLWKEGKLFSAFRPEALERYSARNYGARFSEIIQSVIKTL